jgi:hypothetical protein
MHFEGRLASDLDHIWNLFAEFIKRTYTDDVWMFSDSGPHLVQDNLPVGALQFTVLQAKVPPRWYTGSYCSATFTLPLFRLFNRSLSTCDFSDRFKLSFVTPKFKKGRHNTVEDYRGVAIISAFPKRFKLLVYRSMYDDLMNSCSSYSTYEKETNKV